MQSQKTISGVTATVDYSDGSTAQVTTAVTSLCIPPELQVRLLRIRIETLEKKNKELKAELNAVAVKEQRHWQHWNNRDNRMKEHAEAAAKQFRYRCVTCANTFKKQEVDALVAKTFELPSPNAPSLPRKGLLEID